MYGLFDTSFQKNPHVVAPYVPFDVLQEQEVLRNERHPYAELFAVGGAPYSSSENAKLFLAADGAVLLAVQTGQVVRRYTSVPEALEVESSTALENAA